MSDAQASKLVGTLVADRYRVVRKLAAGGMGVVFLAEQIPLGREVALKVLDTHQLDEERASNFGERFFLEAAAVAKLQHPNTITVYDFGKTSEDLYYYAMEFVAGGSLGQHVHQRGPLDSAAAVHVGLQISGSLHEAHLAGLIHRDLKPGNVMLTSRLGDPHFVKVLDFGLVKVMGGEEVEASDLTQSGMLLGSPRYMAPEQVLRTDLDARCDIYALGGVLYHALTGYPPFRHGSQFEVLRAQVEERPAPLAEAYPFCKATPRLEAVIMRCLEKERRDRFQSMADVAAELVECARMLGIDASLGGALRGQVSSPGQSIPGHSIPGQSVPGHSIPGQSVPGHSIPGHSVPGHSLPSSLTGAGAGASTWLGPSASDISVSGASVGAYAASSMSESQGGMSTSAPAAPGVASSEPARSFGGLAVVALAAVALLSAGAGVFAIVAFGSDWGGAARTEAIAEEPARPRALPDPEPAVAQPPPQPPSPVEEPPSDSPPPAAAASVRLETEPTGARVRRGEVDLGDAPFSVSIPEGEAWTLTFSLAGHETRSVQLTSGRDVLHVRLDPTPGPAVDTAAQRRRTLAPPTTLPPTLPPPVTIPRDPPPRFPDRGDLRHPWGQ